MLQLPSSTTSKARSSPPAARIPHKARRLAPRGAGTTKCPAIKADRPDLAALIAKYDAAEAVLRKAEDHCEELRAAHSVTLADFDDNPKGMPVPLRKARAVEIRLLAAYSAARKAVVNYQPPSPTDAAALLQYAFLSESPALDLHNEDELRALTRNAVGAIRRGRPVRESAGSEIIRQSVVYVQALAAHEAGFKADATGDCEFASDGGLSKAGRALAKLNALSRETAPPLTALEVFAKASSLSEMYGLRKDEELGEDERAYIGHFAKEVVRFLADRCEEVSP
jgi:hypothetical protein